MHAGAAILHGLSGPRVRVSRSSAAMRRSGGPAADRPHCAGHGYRVPDHATPAAITAPVAIGPRRSFFELRDGTVLGPKRRFRILAVAAGWCFGSSTHSRMCLWRCSQQCLATPGRANPRSCREAPALLGGTVGAAWYPSSTHPRAPGAPFFEPRRRRVRFNKVHAGGVGNWLCDLSWKQDRARKNY
jgi:hypothetical protein